MKRIIVEVYELDDLPPDVRSKVIEKNRYTRVEDSCWDDFTLAEWTAKLSDEYGFTGAEINYSGFSSQGDGARFTCAKVNLDVAMALCPLPLKHKPAIIGAIQEHCNLSIPENPRCRYYHKNSVNVELEWQSYCPHEHKRLDKAIEQFTDWLEQERLGLCQQIYRSLEKEYEYYTSDAAVKEDLADCLFFADGRIVDPEMI